MALRINFFILEKISEIDNLFIDINYKILEK